MKQLVACSMIDVGRLQILLKDVAEEVTLLASPGPSGDPIIGGVASKKIGIIHYDRDSFPSLLQELKDLERTYFVVSASPMSSSAYQEMVYRLYPRMLQVECWRITLDRIAIPGGFAFLRQLPEGLPVKNGLGMIGWVRTQFKGTKGKA